MNTTGRARGVALVLAACALSSRALHAAPTGETSVPRASNVLTLSAAVARASQQAPRLLAARKRALGADAATRSARAGYFPTLTAGTGATAMALRDTQALPPPGHGQFVYTDQSLAGNATLSLRWTLLSFGRVSAAVDASDAARGSAFANAEATLRDVQADTARAFVLLYYRRRIVDVTAATLREREAVVALADGLVASGLEPALEGLRSRSRAESARVALESATGDAADAQAVLAYLLGFDADARFDLEPPPLETLGAPGAPSSSDAAELPQVRAAQADARSKAALARAARARFYPSLSFAADAAYTLTRHERDDVWLNTRRVSGMLTASIPVFDRSLSADAESAAANELAARDDAAQIARDVREEMARAALAVASAERALTHARSAALAAQEVLAVVRARYERGLGAPLELIDAESADSDARNASVQAELNRAVALVRAWAASGRRFPEPRYREAEMETK